jgi:hypothetical protein
VAVNLTFLSQEIAKLETGNWLGTSTWESDMVRMFSENLDLPLPVA